MLKGMMFAGLLATVTAGPVFAEASKVDMAVSRSPMGSGAGEQPCYDASNAWLPGTLQIEQRAPPTGRVGPEQRIERAPRQVDCALV